MNEQGYKENIGSLKISEEVLASVAKFAAAEVDGVAGVAEEPSKIKGFFKNNFMRPISIDLTDDIASISMNITVNYGAKISDTAAKVQASVKNAIQSMTGVTVAKVNINITGISFEEKVKD